MIKTNSHKTILIYNSVAYFVPLFFKKGIPVFQVYRPTTSLFTLLKKICLRFDVFRSLWFDDWKNIIKDVETVIVFSTNPLNVLFDIKKINPDVRIIFWYWNPVVKRGIDPNNVPISIAEKWSFDEEDCKKYGMTHNTTFYFDNILLDNNDIKYDIVFIGIDKGRKSFLNSIENQFNSLELNTYFHIVDDEWNKRNYKGKLKPINYSEYLNLVSKSRAILDYIQEGQNGLTLRPLESVFLKKKLITNDFSIIKQDFYNQNNIFILGKDDLATLPKFINSPFVDLPIDILRKYDALQWVNRFFIKGLK